MSESSRNRGMVLGIDLGASNVRAAVASPGHCSVLRLGESSVATPSAVAVINGRVLLGDRARSRAATDPQRVLLNPVAALLRGKASLEDAVYDQDRVIGWWLDSILQRASQERDEPVQAVSICAPSRAVFDVGLWFESAASEAGIPNTHAYPATTAAAVGVVATTQASEGILAVIDVGASQVEAALVELGKGSVRILARARCADTGALALDRKIAEAFVCDVSSLDTFRGLSAAVLQLLCQHCERIRCDLSQVTEARLSVPFLGPTLGQPNLADWVLDRFRLESLARPVADAVLTVCKEAAKLASIAPDRVDLVAAVGGLSRMPLVRRELQVAFGKAPMRQVDPDGAAVSGAALLGASDDGMFSFRANDTESLVASEPPGDSSLYLSVGATMAMRPPVFSEPDERPEESLAETSNPVVESRIVLSPESPGPEAVDGARPSIGEMLRPSATESAPPESSRPSRAPAVDIPRSGTFRNARTPEEMLALPFARRMTTEDVSPPALPILLMHYGRCKQLEAVVHVSFEGQELSIPVVGAQYAPATLGDRDEVLRAFRWSGGSYRIESGVPRNAGRYATESLAKLAIDGIRAVLVDVPEEQVAASMGEGRGMAPKVSKRGLAMAEALEFWSGEQRFLKYRCDGTLITTEAIKAGSVSEQTALRVLFVMLMLGQIQWVAPVKPVQQSLSEQVEALARRLTGADAFESLGVHWSVSESEAQQAHDRLVEMYGPGSEFARVAPEAAAKIVEKAREALPILLDPNKRIALLRRTRPDLDYQSIADLLHKRAVALSMKGQDGAAMEAERVQREVAPLTRHSGFDRRVLRDPPKPPEPKSGNDPT